MFQHLEDFRAAWSGLQKKWIKELLSVERHALDSLATEKGRDAFRIIRSYHRLTRLEKADDFAIVRDNLGARLGISGKGAGGIRDKLETLGVLKRTRNYQPNKFSARYRWLLSD